MSLFVVSAPRALHIRCWYFQSAYYATRLMSSSLGTQCARNQMIQCPLVALLLTYGHVHLYPYRFFGIWPHQHSVSVRRWHWAHSLELACRGRPRVGQSSCNSCNRLSFRYFITVIQLTRIPFRKKDARRIEIVRNAATRRQISYYEIDVKQLPMETVRRA